MITNLISFLYDIKIEIIRKHGNSYIFLYNNNFYMFTKCFINEEYLLYLYNFINNDNVLYHSIVKNRHNKYISSYNNDKYILMMVKFNINRILLLEDINNSCNYHISYVKKTNFNWIKLWKNKIDQVEYFLNNSNIKIDIYSLSIINYYLGLSELSISIFNSVIIDYIPLSICHNRIRTNSDLYEYYSVTDLIIDHKTRDMGEYIKNFIYSNVTLDLSQFNLINDLNIIDKNMLLSRVLFPTYFFDIFDDYVINNKDFNDFYKNFYNLEKYEYNLRTFIDLLKK